MKCVLKPTNIIEGTLLTNEHHYLVTGAYEPPKVAKEHETRVPCQSKLRHRI